MKLNPYLNFNGQCAAAFKFYEQCLGGTNLMMMTHGASPMAAQTPPEWHDKIMHAQLTVGQTVLMGSDAPPEYFVPPQGFSVSLSVDSAAEAEHLFSALAQDGKITMPLQQTFWAARFGMCVDGFGIPWIINGETTAG
ncbi:MAG: VOC family protein [Pseudomonadota bacterium]